MAERAARHEAAEREAGDARTQAGYRQSSHQAWAGSGDGSRSRDEMRALEVLELETEDVIKFSEAAMKLGEAIYKASQEDGDDEPAAADEMGKDDEDIVDADFEDLDNDKRA